MKKPGKPAAALRPGQRPTQRPVSAASAAAARVPQADLVALFGLFNSGRHAEMAANAQVLATRHPADGQAWKAWGIALLVQGQDALAPLQRAMALLPLDAEVPSNLGGVHLARGEFDQAATCYRRALQIQPGFAQAHSNLGDVLARQGQWAAAEARCREALRLQPGLAAAHLNLGNALAGQGRPQEAITSVQQALALNPRMAEAHSALGLALKALGQFDAAAASLRQSLALRPRHAGSHDQLGLLLHSTGQPEAALASFETALQLQPGLVPAQVHRANLLADLGRHADAVAGFRQALALQPGQATVAVNLGVALLALGQTDAAVLSLQQAVAWQPGLALAHSNLGNALMAAGRLGDALPAHQQAVVLAPELALVHSNLGHLFKTLGQPEAALAQLQRALALAPADLALHSAVLFLQQYQAQPLDSVPGPAAAANRSAQHLADARRFGALAARQARPFTTWANPRQPDKCLRIGLLSADLRTHPVGFFLESVLAALARQAAGRIEIHAYANHRADDALSQRLRAHCQGWRPVADQDDATLASTIHADGIDLLIDLSGHTHQNRLPVLAWRPAPVQLSWLGYCASTGVAAVDALIVDPWIAPPGAEAGFAEPLLRLPETFLCFTPPAFDLPVVPLPALAGGGVRFACFNHLAKLNDAVLALWSRILHAVPGSSLVLQSAPLQDAAVRQSVLDRFARHGIGADRLRLQPAQSRADYLAAYAQVDIALDPFPYPGGTTSLEALWMGVPVLTWPGDTTLSRQGLSILQNLGLADWVAQGADDYLARAVQHAGDLAALSALRQGLRDRLLASPLCDAPRFAQHLEVGLRGLWQRWLTPTATGLR